VLVVRFCFPFTFRGARGLGTVVLSGQLTWLLYVYWKQKTARVFKKKECFTAKPC